MELAIKAADGKSQAPTSVKVDKTAGFTAVATHVDETISIMPASEVTWTLTPEGKATMMDGTLTGKSAGSVQLVASAEGVKSAPVTVTVSA